MRKLLALSFMAAIVGVLVVSGNAAAPTNGHRDHRPVEICPNGGLYCNSPLYLSTPLPSASPLYGCAEMFNNPRARGENRGSPNIIDDGDTGDSTVQLLSSSQLRGHHDAAWPYALVVSVERCTRNSDGKTGDLVTQRMVIWLPADAVTVSGNDAMLAKDIEVDGGETTACPTAGCSIVIHRP